jgi:biopolymer transport protein ExbD
MARKTREEEETEINITPMLDIVFIMLIFFIVTTSFVKETGIDPRRPQAETARRAERANILIAVAENGQIWMNKRAVEMGQVRNMVEAALAENPESSVVIIADTESETGAVIDLMDQVRLGGVYNIALAAELP